MKKEKYKIAVLPGDGIGPEVIGEAVKVLRCAADTNGFQLDLQFADVGGVAIDKLAKKGDQEAFRFPKPSLHKGRHTYDVSYSGLKTAVINQLDQFWNGVSEKSAENIAASFQKTAIDIVAERVLRAARDMQLKRIVVGGGVAANSYLRRVLNGFKDYEVIFPSLLYCTDNGAMVAGIGYHYFKAGITSPLSLNAEARVPQFRNLYP